MPVFSTKRHDIGYRAQRDQVQPILYAHAGLGPSCRQGLSNFIGYSNPREVFIRIGIITTFWANHRIGIWDYLTGLVMIADDQVDPQFLSARCLKWRADAAVDGNDYL